MSRYLILLPAPEAEWADAARPRRTRRASASHGTFHDGPQRRGPHPR